MSSLSNSSASTSSSSRDEGDRGFITSRERQDEEQDQGAGGESGVFISSGLSFSQTSSPLKRSGGGGSSSTPGRLEGGAGEASTLNHARGIVERLQHQLYTVRAEKERLEERCLNLEKEMSDLENESGKRDDSRVEAQRLLLTEKAEREATIIRVKRLELQLTEMKDRYNDARSELIEEQEANKTIRMRLASAEAQIKSRDMEIDEWKERYRNGQSRLQESEKKYLQDVSRVLKESSLAASHDMNESEREGWKDEVKQAKREVYLLEEALERKEDSIHQLKAEISRLGVEKEAFEQSASSDIGTLGRGTRGGSRAWPSSPHKASSILTHVLLDSGIDEDEAELEGVVIRQSERLRSSNMIIAALKKALKKSKAEVKILEVRLEASLNLQRELKIELNGLADRHKELSSRLRGHFNFMARARRGGGHDDDLSSDQMPLELLELLEEDMAKMDQYEPHFVSPVRRKGMPMRRGGPQVDQDKLGLLDDVEDDGFGQEEKVGYEEGVEPAMWSSEDDDDLENIQRLQRLGGKKQKKKKKKLGPPARRVAAKAWEIEFVAKDALSDYPEAGYIIRSINKKDRGREGKDEADM